MVASDASEALGDDLVLDGLKEGDGSGSVAVGNIVQDSVLQRDRDDRLQVPNPFRNGFSVVDSTALPPMNLEISGWILGMMAL